MASYEQSVGNVIDNISGLSQSTKDAIASLLGGLDSNALIAQSDGTTPVDAGTQLVTVNAGAHLTQDLGAPVVIMSGNSSADVTFSASSKIDAMVLGSGNNNVTFQADKAISVETTGGQDNITTAGGNDNLVLNGGNATVNTGEGNDSVVLTGANATANVTGGTGDMTIWLDANATGNATVNAGDGFDRLSLQDNRANHTFAVDANGNVIMHSNYGVTMDGVQVVTFDTNKDGQITSADNITVLAENSNDALVATLYKVALGREAIDGADGWGGSTLGGINWWMNEFEKGATDGTTDHLVRSFLNCDEFHAKYDSMSNADYVNTLISNAGISNANQAAWLDALNNGTMDRVDVAYAVATDAETVKVLGVDGENYVIDAYAGA